MASSLCNRFSLDPVMILRAHNFESKLSGLSFVGVVETVEIMIVVGDGHSKMRIFFDLPRQLKQEANSPHDI